MNQSAAVVQVRDVSKRFVIRKEKSLKERVVNFGRSQRHKEDFWALRNVDLEIPAGTTVGLIGPNGSGKSTLLKTIGGIIQPTTGVVHRRGRLAALLELGAGFHPDLTGRENVYLNASILGLSRRQTEQHFDAIVDFSGIERFIDSQVKFYSSGMYVRLAFAVAVHVDPDVLLIDEVLAVGDEPFQRKCMDRIRAFQSDGRTIILVTHALDQVGEICDRAVVLENGRVILDGEPRDALRILRVDFEQARLEEESRRQADSKDRAASVRVVSVGTAGSDGAPLSAIHPGDDVTLTVIIESETKLDNWVLGIGLDTPLGQIVYGTNSKLLETPMPSVQGRCRIDVVLPRLNLGEGQYFVHGAIGEFGGRELHRLPQATTLTVRGDGRGVGVIDVAPVMRVVPLPETDSPVTP